MRKISRLEFITILLCILFLGFASGYFLGKSRTAQPVQIETQRTLSAEDAVIVLPTPEAEEVPSEDGEEGETPEATPDPLEEARPININTADAETLALLPGIGEKRAQDIVEDRTVNGPFRFPEDITRVSGIGESTMEGLLEYITVE